MESLLNKVKKDIRLEPGEKSVMRERIMAFMHENSRQVNDARTLGSAGTLSYQASSTMLGYQILAFRKIVLPVLLILAIGSGTSFAAEGALPGDTLYTVKVGLNEPVKKALAFSASARARIAIDLAGRRLLETEQLAHRGVLTSAVRADLEEKFLTHATEARRHIAAAKVESKLQAETVAEGRDPLDLSSNLESTLVVHERIIGELARKEDVTRNAGINFMLGAVQQESKTATLLKTDTETEVAAHPEFTSKQRVVRQLKVAERQVQDTEALAKKLDKKIRSQTRAEVRARNEVATRIISEARQKLEAGAPREALPLFEKARQISQETKILVETKSEIEKIHEGNDSVEDLEAEEFAPTLPAVEVSATTTTEVGPPPPVVVEPTQIEVKSDSQEHTPSIELRGNAKPRVDIGI